MFRGYLNMEESDRQAFAGGWYLSGDLAEKDEDGELPVRRAGRRRHQVVGAPDRPVRQGRERPDRDQAVAEAGVIGKPDEVAGEIVKAFVSLNPGYEPSEPSRRSCPRSPAEARCADAPENSSSSTPPEDPQRQDHAPAAEGMGARSPHRRHFDPGGRMTTLPERDRR